MRIAIVLGLTAACLVWALWGLDPGEAWRSVTEMRWSLIGLSMLGYVGTHLMRTVRLRILLDAPIPFLRLLSLNSIGFLAINVVPLRLGEFIRPYLLLEQHELPFGRSMAAILLERLVDMCMLLGMLSLVAFAVDLPAGGIQVEGFGEVDVIGAGQKMAGTILTLGALFLGALLIGGEAVVALLQRIVARLPEGARGPAGGLVGFLGSFQRGIRGLFSRPLQGAAVLALSVGLWSCTVGAIGAVLAAFAGVSAGWESALTTWTITLTGMTAFPTPGFVGSFEAFCVAALSLWGVGDSLAAAIAVILHLTQFVFTALIGGGFLAFEGLTLGSLVRESRAAASADP